MTCVAPIPLNVPMRRVEAADDRGFEHKARSAFGVAVVLPAGFFADAVHRIQKLDVVPLDGHLVSRRFLFRRQHELIARRFEIAVAGQGVEQRDASRESEFRVERQRSP